MDVGSSYPKEGPGGHVIEANGSAKLFRPAYLVKLGAASEERVALGELADDLVGRMPRT